jgi:hypothetical protein
MSGDYHRRRRSKHRRARHKRPSGDHQPAVERQVHARTSPAPGPERAVPLSGSPLLRRLALTGSDHRRKELLSRIAERRTERRMKMPLMDGGYSGLFTE